MLLCSGRPRLGFSGELCPHRFKCRLRCCFSCRCCLSLLLNRRLECVLPLLGFLLVFDLLCALWNVAIDGDETSAMNPALPRSSHLLLQSFAHGFLLGIQKILSTLELEINLARHLRRRKDGFLLFGRLLRLLLLGILFLEMRQETIPRFVLELFILGKFTFDHEFLKERS